MITTAEIIAKIQVEVEAGKHDSTQGLRPVDVFVDRDGDIALAYPAGPDWRAWESKVAHGE